MVEKTAESAIWRVYRALKAISFWEHFPNRGGLHFSEELAAMYGTEVCEEAREIETVSCDAEAVLLLKI